MLPQTQQTFLQQEGYLPILAETFITARRAEGLSKNTLRYYREKLDIFLAWCEAQALTQAQEITPDLLRRFLLKMGESHNPGGVHGIYRGVRAFLNFIEAEEIIPAWQNPTRKVKAPRVELPPIEGAPLEDIAAMLDTCDRSITGLRDRAMLLALLDTGARVTEFLAINIEDLDAGGSITLRHTKGKRPRAVFLSTKTRRAIRAYLRSRRDHHPALWLSRHQDRLRPGGLRTVLINRATRAGLKEIPSAHDFRRAFAISYLRDGGDVFTLQRILGHQDLTVLRRYLALTNTDTQQAHAIHSPVERLK